MNSLILRTTTQFMLPLLMLLSLFFLLRGHNEPGGGFVGGLTAAAALALYALAYDVASARFVLRVDPSLLIGGGLLLALASGVSALLAGEAFLRGLWIHPTLPGLGSVHVGTPLVFDLGVYLVVIGVTLTVVFSLMEE